jgi:gluconolactonase
MKNAAFTLAFAIFTAGCSSTTPASAPGKETSGVGSIARLDPAFDALVPRDAHIEKLAGDSQFTEGPVWRPQEQHLWFSDVMANVVRQWSPDGKAKIVIQHGGSDKDGMPGGLIGPNGEIADKGGAVLICQHGNRRIVRVSKDLQITPVVDRFEGKRFNGPNDLVYRYDGSLYFTDPPYGLTKQDNDPAKELPFNGVFRLSNSELQVVIRDLTRA